MSHNEHHNLNNAELPHSPSKGVVTEEDSITNSTYTTTSSRSNASQSSKNSEKNNKAF